MKNEPPIVTLSADRFKWRPVLALNLKKQTKLLDWIDGIDSDAWIMNHLDESFNLRINAED
jgi:hypothetical protein